MLMEPCVVIVVLLLHETLLDDDCEDVGNHTNRDEDPGVEVKLCRKALNLDHIVVSVPNHVSVHQSK